MTPKPKKTPASVQPEDPRVKELTAALQRERADAMNLRRRHAEELTKLRNYQKATVILDLLPVIDNFERALKHIPKDLTSNNFIKGVEAIVKQFEKTLAGMGVQKIKTVGELFNPKYHEAVSLEEGPGHKEIVSEELQTGYTLGNEVIRHAVVKVRLK